MIFLYLILDLIFVVAFGYGILQGLHWVSEKGYIGVSDRKYDNGAYHNTNKYVDQSNVRIFAGVVFSIFSVLLVLITLIVNLKGCCN